MKARESGMPEEKLWKSFFSIDKIINELEIISNINTIAELGFGYGTFTIPVSKIISGNLYAFDIETSLLIDLQSKLKENNIFNVIPERRDFIIEGSGLNDGEIDYFMLFNILHAEESEIILKETHRLLRDKGKVGIIHWNYDETTPRGPSMNIRPKPESLKYLLIKNGFTILKYNIDLPPYHYGILAEKN